MNLRDKEFSSSEAKEKRFQRAHQAANVHRIEWWNTVFARVKAKVTTVGWLLLPGRLLGSQHPNIID